MNNFATPFGLPDTAPALALRFGAIMAGLGALVAARFGRMPHLSVYTMLLWTRLNRAVRRFHRALTQAPGKTRAPHIQAARMAGTQARPLALPQGRGWLLRELGWEAAAYKTYLELLLAGPDMQAALAQRPAAGRMLRPLCRMLGIPEPATAALADGPARVVAAEAHQAWPARRDDRRGSNADMAADREGFAVLARE